MTSIPVQNAAVPSARPGAAPPPVEGGAPLRDLVLTDTDFKIVADLAYRHFGLNLHDGKQNLVHSRLARRVNRLGLPDFSTYVAWLQADGWEAEHLHFLSALTTNTTHFFREAHHFKILEQKLLPNLIKRAQSGGRVRLWSAACSAGQEAYSIAISILKHCPDAARLDIKVLATDIDPQIVETARKATYSANIVQELAQAGHDGVAVPSSDVPGHVTLPDPVKDLVTFGTLNLIRPLPFAGPFDAIFCRNVTIYFDQPTGEAVWDRLRQVSAPGGHLYIGHSERLTGATAKHFTPIGITAYAHTPA